MRGEAADLLGQREGLGLESLVRDGAGDEADALRARHPSLVLATVGGFPGADADRPAYDLLAQAVSVNGANGQIKVLAANLVGLFIHNLTEEGQRRAFLDTRDCIAARLEMEDENEKLVSTTLYLLLYSSVADPYSLNPNPAKNMIPDPEDP